MPGVAIRLPPDLKDLLRLSLLLVGVTLKECCAARITGKTDGVQVSLIHLDNPKIKKQASGRHKDDLEHLP
jgi:hypothetical protein